MTINNFTHFFSNSWLDSKSLILSHLSEQEILNLSSVNTKIYHLIQHFKILKSYQFQKSWNTIQSLKESEIQNLDYNQKSFFFNTLAFGLMNGFQTNISIKNKELLIEAFELNYQENLNKEKVKNLLQKVKKLQIDQDQFDILIQIANACLYREKKIFKCSDKAILKILKTMKRSPSQDENLYRYGKIVKKVDLKNSLKIAKKISAYNPKKFFLICDIAEEALNKNMISFGTDCLKEAKLIYTDTYTPKSYQSERMMHLISLYPYSDDLNKMFNQLSLNYILAYSPSACEPLLIPPYCKMYKYHLKQNNINELDFCLNILRSAEKKIEMSKKDASELVYYATQLALIETNVTNKNRYLEKAFDIAQGNKIDRRSLKELNFVYHLSITNKNFELAKEIKSFIYKSIENEHDPLKKLLLLDAIKKTFL